MEESDGESSKNPTCANANNAASAASTQEVQQKEEAENDAEILKEIAIQSIDLNVATCSTGLSKPFTVISKLSTLNELRDNSMAATTSRVPLVVIQSPRGRQTPISTQPTRNTSSLSFLISPMSLINTMPNQPQSLFMQALAKLNESSSVAVVNHMRRLADEAVTQATGGKVEYSPKSPSLSTPDSLTSAPPSYSFVLRQSTARRRPRLMGTFIPSPSFVQHTPPPNYAAAFDIYVDNAIPQQPPRVYTFGFASMPVICPECGYAGLTAVTSKITVCTHLCALLLCLFCCWFCSPLPYIMRSCKDVYHHCRNCRTMLGMYSPSNPESGPNPYAV